MSSIRRSATSTALWLGVSSCALLGKGEALSPRYFSPDLSAARAPAPASAPRESIAAAELRLGRITAASYLGDRIVFRDSNYELNFYEDRRWTEKPEIYLRRALSRSFFEERGLHRIVSGAGPTLEVELTELAELRLATPVARVRATYILYDNRLVRRETSVTVELPIVVGSQERESPPAAVRVMSDALNSAVQRIVDQVVADLGARHPG